MDNELQELLTLLSLPAGVMQLKSAFHHTPAAYMCKRKDIIHPTATVLLRRYQPYVNCVHTCMSVALISGVIGYNEQWDKKHGVSDVFQKNLACRGFRTLGLHRTSCMEAFYSSVMYFFNMWILVNNHYNCLEHDCNIFFLWNSTRILWTKKLYPTLHRHEAELVMTEFSFLGELSLKGLRKIYI